MAVRPPGQKGNGAERPLWRPSWVALRILAFVLVISSAACASQETRYRILTLFFDGVPPPYQAPAPGTAVEAAVEVAAPQPSAHPPFKQRRCELCHNRQMSNALIVEKHKLCGICHTADMFDGPFKHGPVASSQCYACHDPHQSKFPNLLFDLGSTVCAKCHTEETVQGMDLHRSEQGEECLNCHRPHVAEKRYLLK